MTLRKNDTIFDASHRLVHFDVESDFEDPSIVFATPHVESFYAEEQ